VNTLALILQLHGRISDGSPFFADGSTIVNFAFGPTSAAECPVATAAAVILRAPSGTGFGEHQLFFAYPQPNNRIQFHWLVLRFFFFFHSLKQNL
jgi:hypothetical protein